MNSWIKEIVALFYPEECSVCGCALTACDEVICRNCEKRIPFIIKGTCVLCSRPLEIFSDDMCYGCKQTKRYYNACYAAGLYDGVLRDLIQQFKYNKRKEIASVLGNFMLRTLDERIVPDSYDVIVPVPIHWYHRAKRGFNQSYLLAKQVHRRTEKPLLGSLLVKKKYTGTQVAKGRSGRLREIKGSIAVKKKKIIEGEKVLLIDDVFTTGATVNECAEVLIQHGAASITVLVAARG